jgi:hypothetical protein
MPPFKIGPKSTVVAGVAVTVVVIGIALVYVNRPALRVSLPAGAEFPACLLDDALMPLQPKCDTSVKCTANIPGGLGYSKGRDPVSDGMRNWCCPDGTSTDFDVTDPNGKRLCKVDKK